MEIPPVRQDRRPESPTFGAIAVKLPDGSPLGEWGFMTLTSGGGFLPASQVAAWTELNAPTDA